MNKLKEYAGLLNEDAPKDHFLAYITAGERDMLVDAGGKKTSTSSGIFAYPPNMGDPNYAHAESNQNTGGNDNQDSDETSWSAEDHTPTGWTGDAGVDAWESQHGGRFGAVPFDGGANYQRTQFTGGTYATDDNQAFRTLSYGDDAATEDMGRPDITYYQPTGTTMGDYKSKYELNNIKYIQDSKLKTVKNKLNKAGFKIDKDANFAETKAFIYDLSSDKLPDFYRDLKDSNGDPLYSPETIEKWEAENYMPKGGQTNFPSIGGAILNKIDKPLTRDELLFSLNEATQVGKSGGGKMNHEERMKNFMPNQYAAQNNMIYNPHTKIFTPRTNERDVVERVASPYTIGGTTPPQESQVVNYFANLNNANSGINQNYLNTYNAAKTNIANTLNMTQNTSQYGYGNTFNDNYARSMTTANPFYNELTSEGLI